MHSHTVKMGKWRTKAARDTNCSENWRMVLVMHNTFAPAAHLESYFMKMRRGTGVSPMLNFMVLKCSVIKDEFDALISDAAWSTTWARLVGMTDDAALPRWIETVVIHSIEICTDYVNRFQIPFCSYPRKLLWIVAAPHNEYSETRRDVARQLVELTDDQLVRVGDLAQKIRTIFLAELRAASVNGFLDLALWDLLHTIAELWHVDTQDIEGCNNILKYIMHLCPGIAWALLSARITSKKEIIQCGDDLDGLASRCVDHHDAAVAHLRDTGATRFSELDCSNIPPPDLLADWIALGRRSTLHERAAAAVWLKMQDKCKNVERLGGRLSASARYCLRVTHAIDSPADDGEVEVQADCFFISMSYRRQLWAIPATEYVSINDDYVHDGYAGTVPSSLYVQIVLPVRPKLLLEILAGQLGLPFSTACGLGGLTPGF